MTVLCQLVIDLTGVCPIAAFDLSMCNFDERLFTSANLFFSFVAQSMDSWKASSLYMIEATKVCNNHCCLCL